MSICANAFNLLAHKRNYRFPEKGIRYPESFMYKENSLALPMRNIFYLWALKHFRIRVPKLICVSFDGSSPSLFSPLCVCLSLHNSYFYMRRGQWHSLSAQQEKSPENDCHLPRTGILPANAAFDLRSLIFLCGSSTDPRAENKCSSMCGRR